MDGVDGAVVGHAEVYDPSDVPELHEVVSVYLICFKLDLLAVDIERLAGGAGGEHRLRRLGGGTAQGEARQDAEPQKYRFSHSAHHDSSLPLFGVSADTTIPKPGQEVENNQCALWRKTEGETKHIAQRRRQTSRAVTHQR